VVKLARQVSLDRRVAVKSLKGAPSPDEIEALLGEPWLAGGLEHPGILPIYAVSLDPDGRPQVVMKRIEGVTGSKLLSGEADRASYAPARTALESHLKIALQVCNAVHFAHSRGVIHRDLKPDNVMVGGFGEVYVVDWGIATAPGPSNQLAGTPAYMSPEMLGNGAEISSATDVYLLGSVLSEVLSGKAPHHGRSAQEIFSSVLSSTPALPPDAPVELVDLVRRCMARNPADRPKSALEVRQAIERFLEHQGSLELVEQSELRAAELPHVLAEAAPDPIRVSRLFSECRFGLEQALRVWPENDAARTSLFRLTTQQVRYELAHGSLRQTQTLLAQLSPPPEELVTALAQAKEAENKRAESSSASSCSTSRSTHSRGAQCAQSWSPSSASSGPPRRSPRSSCKGGSRSTSFWPRFRSTS
jgi:serine/threonine-protein kinase